MLDDIKEFFSFVGRPKKDGRKLVVAETLSVETNGDDKLVFIALKFKDTTVISPLDRGELEQFVIALITAREQMIRG